MGSRRDGRRSPRCGARLPRRAARVTGGIRLLEDLRERVYALLGGDPTPQALHALYLTILIAIIAVPLNTVFGILCALVLVRQRFRGKGVLNALIDLPFALSPVVVGLSLILVYGRGGWFGGWLTENGVRIIFAVPGMVLATVFISLPFVVREVVPVLREIGTEQEEAAATLGASQLTTFWRVTLPSIRWGVTYGVVLTTARAPRRVRGCLSRLG